MAPYYIHYQVKLVVFFLYGEDFHRQSVLSNIINFFISSSFIPIYVLFLFLTIVLHCVRRLVNVPRSFFTTWMDVCSVSIGGGQLQYRHKWERVFFAIAMIGSFFLISVIMAKFEMKAVISMNDDKIDTFEKLSKKNVPIYYADYWSSDKGVVEIRIRYLCAAQI